MRERGKRGNRERERKREGERENEGIVSTHLVRDLRVAGHVQLQLGGGDVHVRVIELVRNIPSQRSELLPLDNERVIEGQAEEQPHELLRLR